MPEKHILEEWVLESLFKVSERAKETVEKDSLTDEEIFKSSLHCLGVDSLDVVEFVMELEDRFEITLGGDDICEKFYDMTIEQITVEVNRAIEEQP